MTSAETLVDWLRQHGQRITTQRRLVIEILCGNHKHLTLQDIQNEILKAGYTLSEPTVYRILQWLKAQEIISQTDMGGNIVYQIIDNDSRHHHLICLNCGQIIDIDDTLMAILRQQIHQEHRFTPRIDHMAIFGLCQNCQ